MDKDFLVEEELLQDNHFPVNLEFQMVSYKIELNLVVDSHILVVL